MNSYKRRYLIILVVMSFCLGLSNTPIIAGPTEQDKPRTVDQTIQGARDLEYVGRIGGKISSVAVQGNYAYVGEGYGLTILDISDPASPTPVSKSLPLPDYVWYVDVLGDYVYVAVQSYDNLGSLNILDVSDPGNPVEVGFYAMPGTATGVAISDSYVYVAIYEYDDYDYIYSLRIIDVSDPANPIEVGSYEAPNDIWAVAVLGSYAYVAGSHLRVVDVSNPAAPVEVSFIAMPGSVSGVFISGSYAYVLVVSALLVLDISNPVNPVEVGFYPALGGTDMAFSESHAYCSSSSGLSILDISDPANIVEIGFYSTADVAIDVAISGSYAYVAVSDFEYSTSISVVDVSSPTNPIGISGYSTAFAPYGMTISGSYAYVLDLVDDMRIMDMSDPANPVQVGSYDSPDYIYDLVISGSYAYMTSHGLRVVDVSNPANPVQVGFLDLTSGGYLALSGSYLYVTSDGLRVVDISNPANPVQVGFLEAALYGNLAISGSYAYVAAEFDGLRVVDISDPANPIEVGYFYNPIGFGPACDVAASESFAYVTGCYLALWVMDVSDPTNPVAVGYYDQQGLLSDVTLSGGYVYAVNSNSADLDGSLRILDFSDPLNPEQISSYGIYGRCSEVTVSEDLVYLSTDEDGLLILRFNKPLLDNGFFSNLDGYGFTNYGAKDYGDYTFPDMQHMFGDSPVCWTVGSGCEAKAQASSWNVHSYHMMNSGHSYGMAISGLRFFKDVDEHPADPSVYDMDKTSDVLFSWEGENITTTLRRDIGFFTVSQFVEPLRSTIHQSLEQTPAEVYAQLEASMMGDAPDPLILFMFSEDKGHTLTPYAITSPSSGVYNVWVYDSEHPGDVERAVIFDLNANTWSYDTGEEVWGGDASSHNLGTVPTSVHSQTLDCPWCTSSHLLSLEGKGHLLVSDSQDRRLGYLGDSYVAEIPGAYGSPPLLGTGVAHEPLYTLPLTETYTLLLDGQTVSQTAPASLWQFGPGYAASLQDVNIGPATQDTLTISGDGTLFGYHASGAQEPTLILALDVLSATYGLDVQWFDIDAGEAVTLTVEATQGVLTLDGSHASGGFYNLLIRKTSEIGGFPFYHDDIEILAADTHIIHFGDWDGYGAITLEIDHGSDGTIDETLLLVNQVQWSMLPLLVK